MHENRNGLMEELIEELMKKGYTQTEIKRELRRRGLQHYGLREPRYLVGFSAMLFLGYISTAVKSLDLHVLHFLLQLPTMDFH